MQIIQNANRIHAYFAKKQLLPLTLQKKNQHSTQGIFLHFIFLNKAHFFVFSKNLQTFLFLFKQNIKLKIKRKIFLSKKFIFLTIENFIEIQNVRIFKLWASAKFCSAVFIFYDFCCTTTHHNQTTRSRAFTQSWHNCW